MKSYFLGMITVCEHPSVQCGHSDASFFQDPPLDSSKVTMMERITARPSAFSLAAPVSLHQMAKKDQSDVNTQHF